MIDLEFNHVSKRYRVRPDEATTGETPHHFLRGLQRLRRRSEEFWAVRDVSFKVNRGEALGIIGHNGAGKSTVLKLLSGITAPTSGEIKINGRMAALIEVGSGFHPELTGRENVFLSGSILGMRRREIAAKLDSIVEFAGVRQFIDTPVKRYSSGMYVRLGFAIAAHLDPDILLLDEVLAVGDAAFQAKCFKRIEELQHAGKTIIFISHDLDSVERLCSRALLMNKGSVAAEGLPRDVIAEYQRAGGALAAGARPHIRPARTWGEGDDAPGNEVVRLREVRVRTKAGETVAEVDIRRPVGIELVYDVIEPGHLLIPNYHFTNGDGLYLFPLQDVNSEWRRRPRPVGRYTSTAWVPGNFLAAGHMKVDVAVSSHVPDISVHAYAQDVVSFQVVDTIGGDSARGDFTGAMAGVIRPVVDWTTDYDPTAVTTVPNEEVIAI